MFQMPLLDHVCLISLSGSFQNIQSQKLSTSYLKRGNYEYWADSTLWKRAANVIKTLMSEPVRTTALAENLVALVQDANS